MVSGAFSQNQDAVGGTHGFGEVVGDQEIAVLRLSRMMVLISSQTVKRV